MVFRKLCDLDKSSLSIGKVKSQHLLLVSGTFSSFRDQSVKYPTMFSAGMEFLRASLSGFVFQYIKQP